MSKKQFRIKELSGENQCLYCGKSLVNVHHLEMEYFSGGGMETNICPVCLTELKELIEDAFALPF